MNGLKDLFRAEVRLHGTSDLGHTMKLAKKVKEKYSVGPERDEPTRKIGSWVK